MDTVTTVKVASEVANSQAVWAILFIILISYVLWFQRKDKLATEERQRLERAEMLAIQKDFGTALASQAETMKEISASLQETNRSMRNLEGRIDNIEKSGYSRHNNRNYNGKGGE